jgi:hypothetical protein
VTAEERARELEERLRAAEAELARVREQSVAELQRYVFFVRSSSVRSSVIVSMALCTSLQVTCVYRREVELEREREASRAEIERLEQLLEENREESEVQRARTEVRASPRPLLSRRSWRSHRDCGMSASSFSGCREWVQRMQCVSGC